MTANVINYEGLLIFGKLIQGQRAMPPKIIHKHSCQSQSVDQSLSQLHFDHISNLLFIVSFICILLS